MTDQNSAPVMTQEERRVFLTKLRWLYLLSVLCTLLGAVGTIFFFWVGAAEHYNTYLSLCGVMTCTSIAAWSGRWMYRNYLCLTEDSALAEAWQCSKQNRTNADSAYLRRIKRNILLGLLALIAAAVGFYSVLFRAQLSYRGEQLGSILCYAVSVGGATYVFQGLYLLAAPEKQRPTRVAAQDERIQQLHAQTQNLAARVTFAAAYGIMLLAFYFDQTAVSLTIIALLLVYGLSHGLIYSWLSKHR